MPLNYWWMGRSNNAAQAHSPPEGGLHSLRRGLGRRRSASTIPTATSPEIPIKTAPADICIPFVTVSSHPPPERNLLLF